MMLYLWTIELYWSVEHKMKMKIKVDSSSSFSSSALCFALHHHIFNADLWADVHLTLNTSIYGFTFTVTLNITILGKFTCLFDQPIFFNFSSNVFLSLIWIFPSLRTGFRDEFLPDCVYLTGFMFALVLRFLFLILVYG